MSVEIDAVRGAVRCGNQKSMVRTLRSESRERDLEASKLQQETWSVKVVIGHLVSETVNARWPTSGGYESDDNTSR